MVDLQQWGELQELLEEYPNDILKELCYILGLRRSGSKQDLIDEIKNSEYTYQYVMKRQNFLIFGVMVVFQHFKSPRLTKLIRDFDLPRGRNNWDKMVEIIRSEKITPRMLLGQLTNDVLKSIYIDIYDVKPTLDRDGIIRKIIAFYQLEWLEEIMDKGFILMPMAEDPELEKTYQIIKDECKKADINAIRIDEIHSSAKVDEKVLEHIDDSEYLIVDLTNERPNVYYELGYAHGHGKKFENIILLARKGTPLHFDIRNMSTIFYKDHKHLRKELNKRLKAIKTR
ncbi:MAG: hypothetical protein JSV56_06395 [Methanomassiliicoccales archaeon]|nr:MAG: hypothetical protein JSV56_06395 [Methanomassiliicoccales archaeon]